jgi:hypothetical protein
MELLDRRIVETQTISTPPVFNTKGVIIKHDDCCSPLETIKKDQRLIVNHSFFITPFLQSRYLNRFGMRYLKIQLTLNDFRVF